MKMYRSVKGKRWQRILLSIVASSCLTAGAEEVSKKTLAELTAEEQRTLVESMTETVNKEGSKGFFFEDDASPVRAKLTLDTAANYIVIDLDERLGPVSQSAEMEDLFDKFRFAIDDQLKDMGGSIGITYLFGGKESDLWYPAISSEATARLRARYPQRVPQ